MTAPQQLYIGDDWTVLVPVTNPDGSPVNLTAAGLTPGGEFWQYNASVPQDLTVANGGVTIVDAVNGKFTFGIVRTVTQAATAQAPTANNFPTRIQAFVTDALGRRTTLGIITIIPLDPRTA